MSQAAPKPYLIKQTKVLINQQRSDQRQITAESLDLNIFHGLKRQIKNVKQPIRTEQDENGVRLFLLPNYQLNQKQPNQQKHSTQGSIKIYQKNFFRISGSNRTSSQTTMDNLSILDKVIGDQNIIFKQEFENFTLNQMVKSGVFKMPRRKQRYSQLSSTFSQLGRQDSTARIQTNDSQGRQQESQIPLLSQPISQTKGQHESKLQSCDSLIEEEEPDHSKSKSSLDDKQVAKPYKKRSKQVLNSRFSEIIAFAEQQAVASELEQQTFDPSSRLMMFSKTVGKFARKIRSKTTKFSEEPEQIIDRGDTPSMKGSYIKRDSERQATRRIGLRVSQQDSIAKAMSQIQMPQPEQVPIHETIVRQLHYLESTEELVVSHVSHQESPIKQGRSSLSLSEQTKLWIPSFFAKFMYKDIFHHWQLKLVSIGGSNNSIFLFDQTFNKYAYSFSLPEITTTQIQQTQSATFWPQIVKLQLKRIIEKGCKNIVNVMNYNTQQHLRKKGKPQEQFYMHKLIQFLVQRLIFQERKVTGIVLQFVPSQYNEIKRDLDYEGFMEANRQICNKIYRIMNHQRRQQQIIASFSEQNPTDNENLQDFLSHNADHLQLLMKFRFSSQINSQYLVQVEIIRLHILANDEDFLQSILAVYASRVLMKISLVQSSCMTDFIGDDLFDSDHYEFLFEIEFLPRFICRKPSETKNKDEKKKTGAFTNQSGRLKASLNIQPLRLKLGAILQVLEDQRYQFSDTNTFRSHVNMQKILLQVLTEKQQSNQLLSLLRELANTKFTINPEKHQLELKQQISTISDVRKLQAAGIQLSFLTKQNTSQIPSYAISILECLLREEKYKQRQQITKSIYFSPENLFSSYFYKCNDQENLPRDQTLKSQQSLHQLMKKYTQKLQHQS